MKAKTLTIFGSSEYKSELEKFFLFLKRLFKENSGTSLPIIGEDNFEVSLLNEKKKKIQTINVINMGK